jgi:surface antigen
MPPISYTPKPAWTDAQGRQCREYKSIQMINGQPTEAYGAACREPNGEWRAVQ